MLLYELIAGHAQVIRHGGLSGLVGGPGGGDGPPRPPARLLRALRPPRAGLGGRLLIIGSAACVVAMGLEKINFGWYLKRISLLALSGYLAGIAVIWLEHVLIGL